MMFKERYTGKHILAPMVRIGTLPMRLLALDYGADLVYTEELIDYKLTTCRRVQNTILDTIDYIDVDGMVVFRTCLREKDKLILQMGTNDADRALKVGKFIEQDISGIDINMGCPKEFSLKGGMGAALLSQPEKIKLILTTLVKNLKIPVTCKIRVLPTLEETLELCKMIEATGVAAVAVHGRQKEERPQHLNRNNFIKVISQALSIPVISNGGSGDIKCYSDIEKFKEATGTSSVMIARAAEKNVSIFSQADKLEELEILIVKYLRLAVDFNNVAHNTKYCIQQMLGSFQDTPNGRLLLNAHTLQDICKIWNLEDYYIQQNKIFQSKKRSLDPQTITLKRRKFEEGEIFEMKVKFIRNMYEGNNLPKSVLYNWSLKNKLSPLPKYQTETIDKRFYTTVNVGGKKYTNSLGEKNRKQSEQAAALVAGLVLGLIEEAEKILEKTTFLN